MRHPFFTLVLGLVVLMTAGCGFHLRGTTQLPAQFHNMILDSGDPYGPTTRAIREQLRLNNINIVDDAKRKDIPSLRLMGETLTRSTASIFQDGKAAEYQFILTMKAQVLIPGSDIYPISISVFRSFFDNPLAALAKEAEQDIVLKEMREQAAQQLVRKLLTIKGAQTEKNKPQAAVAKPAHP
ncbi:MULTISPECIES: LPS assembly lipoprotein LptE [Dickeya]|uniref:LPS-assembly lipoprotein LptE n=1 Tax=Dickeya aquatica TaxID=1401087 RepID=A0A375ACY6_9GAMM|nr:MULTISPECIES: LPS assembly lipoprotein LptE [Dickeya]SLM63875.1 Lipopolysaccharide assembly [Dickeya aquatica]